MEKITDLKQVLSIEQIESKIYVYKDRKVMIDSDLAALYGVLTKNLNRAVNRNRERFPPDFIFLLTNQEVTNLRFQIGTSSFESHGGRRYSAYAFTQEGIAMLSSVLKSTKAVQINILIMRAFVRLRELIISHKDLQRKISDLESRYDKQFKTVFDALREITTVQIPNSKRRKIGLDPNSS